MCYSVKTSIISYSLGMAAAVAAFLTKQYILGMLILFYVQMQLSEAMIWRGLDTNNQELNRVGTSYGKYLLATHNIAIGLGILIAIYMENKKLQPRDFIPLLIGIVFFIAILIVYATTTYEDVTYPANRSCFDKSCQNNGNRLQWPFPHSWYGLSFIISLIFMIIYIKPISSKIFIGSLFTITFLLSGIVYPASVGSVWCFVSAILAPLLVIINYYLQRNIT